MAMIFSWWPKRATEPMRWKKFEATQPDVCFLDIRMPIRSGLEVATEIGDRSRIVFCTAYDQFCDRGI